MISGIELAFIRIGVRAVQARNLRRGVPRLILSSVNLGFWQNFCLDGPEVLESPGVLEGSTSGKEEAPRVALDPPCTPHERL